MSREAPSSRWAETLLADWYRPRLTPLSAALLPLAGLFAGLSRLRRAAYRLGWLAQHRLPVPVVVVGNIVVGGSGKTPVVQWLAGRLAEAGWHPGIIARGYGGSVAAPTVLDSHSTPAVVGDEPLLHHAQGWPVAVGRDRAAAGQALLAAHPDVDLIIADDGLQHYRLARDAEIAVFDSARGVGNGWPLPAGPLREHPRRLIGCDGVIWNGGVTFGNPVATWYDCNYGLRLVPGHACSLANPQQRRPLAELFAGAGGEAHALAGIGHPERFFAMLEAQGGRIIRHPFPDHHRYNANDLALPKARLILLTAKDAVKCRALERVCDDPRIWVVPVMPQVDDGEHLLECLLRRLAGNSRHSSPPGAHHTNAGRGS